MSELKKQREELIHDFKNVQDKIKKYVDSLKMKGSEELLNGSVEKAQKLIGAIIPVDSAAKKLKKEQDDLLNVLESQDESEESDETEREPETHNKSSDEIENTPDEVPVTEEQTDLPSAETVPVQEFSEDDLTPQESFRLPILKALIYLGGSGKVKDISNFIEKDMKNKFRPLDNDILNGDDVKEWVKRVNKEQQAMTAEGLLNADASEGYWEIAQAGIDYLAKNKKAN